MRFVTFQSLNFSNPRTGFKSLTLTAPPPCRSVVEVFKTGSNINLRMLEIAQAFVEPSWVWQCNSTAYYEAEAVGKATGTGVWSVPGGIPRPWDCRTNRTLCATTTTGRKLMGVSL